MGARTGDWTTRQIQEMEARNANGIDSLPVYGIKSVLTEHREPEKALNGK